MPFEYRDPDGIIELRGLIGRPGLARRSRAWETFIINRRPVHVPVLVRAVEDAWQGRLMRGEYPFALLYLGIAPHLIDVNVHPQKLELRFWNDSQVYRTVRQAVTEALESAGHVQLVDGEATQSDAEARTPEQAQSKVDERPSTSDKQQTQDSGWIQPPLHDTQPRRPERPDSGAAAPSWPAAERPSGIPFAYAPRDGAYAPGSQHATTAPRSAESLGEAREEAGDDERRALCQRLVEARLVGVLFDTYLILETADACYLLDQHAAHEKVLYERLLASESGSQQAASFSHALLSPLPLELGPADLARLLAERNSLEALGYRFSDDAAPALVAIPTQAPTHQPLARLMQVLDHLSSEPVDQTLESDREAQLLALATRACKAAVKAHDRLDHMELVALIEQLAMLDQPFQCPHGRPIVVRMSLGEIERRFRRIV